MAHVHTLNMLGVLPWRAGLRDAGNPVSWTIFEFRENEAVFFSRMRPASGAGTVPFWRW